MKCAKCDAELRDGAKFCDLCGVEQSVGQPDGSISEPGGASAAPESMSRSKKLVTYRMLSLFLGSLGVHSFYAGYVGKGVVQLLLSWTGISGIWALVDVFTVTCDADGRQMEDTVPKDIVLYRVLAFFCGGIGAHNFYAGRLGRGLVQILLGWTGISWIWALVEMFTVKEDANGRPMVSGQPAGKSAKFSLIFAGSRLVCEVEYWIVWYNLHRALFYGNREMVVSRYMPFLVLAIFSLFGMAFSYLGVAFGAVALSKRQYLGIVSIALVVITALSGYVMPPLLLKLMH